MRIDCQWVSTNLEAISCDSLGAEEARLVRDHIQDCAHCRSEIESLEAIDVVIKKYVRHQMAVAHSPGRPRVAWGYVGAAAAVAIALVMAVSLQLQPGPASLPPAPDQSVTAPAPAENPGLDKDSESTATLRAKPEEAGPAAGAASGGPAAAAAAAAAGPDASGAPEFVITDPAGYSRTLEDYKGYVLFFGVWQPTQPEAIANIERVYKTFGSNTRLRIVGISNQREANPANTTFPLFYNQGSRLLNAVPGEFVLLDQTGAVRLRGSLLTPPDNLMKVLRDALQPLAIQ